MANSSLALLVRPARVDLGGILNTASGLEDAEARRRSTNVASSLNELTLRDETDKSSARRDYRTALKGGDKNASAKLAGYPELQAEFHKTFESLKPDAKDVAVKRITALGTVARELAAFPEGSRERAMAAERLLPGLVAAGYISQEVAAQVSKTGVPDALIEQAQTAEDWVSSALKAKADTGPLSPKDRLEIEDKVAAFAKDYFGSNNYSFLSEEQVAERNQATAAYRQRLISELSTPRGSAAPSANILDLTRRAPASSSPAGPAAPSLTSPTPMADQGAQPQAGGDGTSKEAAIQFTSGREQQEFDALPSGSWFVNPADGRVLFKK